MTQSQDFVEILSGQEFSHNKLVTESGDAFFLDKQGGVKNRYTYNGKELLSDLDVNWHYYGFRVYDPAIGRFTSVDPIAEKFAFVSGFNYAENKPINSIDLHGLQGVIMVRAPLVRGRVRPSPNYARNRRNFAQAKTNAQRDGMRTQRMSITQGRKASEVRSQALESINPMSNTFDRFPSISSFGNDSRTQNFERIYMVVDHAMKFTKKIIKSTSLDLVGDSESIMVRDLATNYMPAEKDLAEQLARAEQIYQRALGLQQQKYIDEGLSSNKAFLRAYFDLGPSPQEMFNKYARRLDKFDAVDRGRENIIYYPRISPSR